MSLLLVRNKKQDARLDQVFLNRVGRSCFAWGGNQIQGLLAC